MRQNSSFHLAVGFVLLQQTASFVQHRNGWLSVPTPARIDSPLAQTYLSFPWGSLTLASSTQSTDTDTGRRPSEGGRPNRPPNPNGRPPRPNGAFNSNRSNGSSNNSKNNNPRSVNRSGPPRSPSSSGGGGGGGAGLLKLTNPMKLVKLVEQVPQTLAERNDELERFASGTWQESSPPPSSSSSNGGGGRPQQRPSRPVGSTGNTPRKPGPGGGGGDDSGPVATKDFTRKRTDFDKKKKVRPETADDRGPRRPSLRVGTGKKGRSAEITQRRGSLRKRDRTSLKEAKAAAAVERRTVDLPEGPVPVQDLAELLGEKPTTVIKFLMTDLGVMATMTQNLDPATCVAVVEGLGRIVAGSEDDFEDDEDEDDDEEYEESALDRGVVTLEDDPADLRPRAPVVTIMGHVDHGKTTLLDTIRKTQVTAGEAGGITQHIAAYQVDHNGQSITFVDTPGHAAFTDMRERGANITDIVILVVAADDGVKQQTADSIACARRSGVPLIVAVNKIDLEAADPMKTMTELTQYDILTEEFGGEVLSSQISAKAGTGIEDLLDKIMLQAEIENLKANPDRDAECIVIEAKIEKGLGTVATTLVKKGTLRVGDIFVAGETYGRVKALISTADDRTRLMEAGPSMPVRVVGFEGIPSAGDVLVVAESDQVARELAESRHRIARERDSSSYQSGLMDSVQLAFGSNKEKREMCVVVKADVQGTAEALTRALRGLKREDDEAVVTVKVLVSEAGEVSKSDIAIASVAPDTTVIAFGVPASYAAMEDARALNIPIEYYSIVYDAIESVESRMQEVLSPTPNGEFVGAALVQEVFNIGGFGNIAGSRCTNGYLKKGANVRVLRGDKILIESKIKSLRNFKAEADSIEEGIECGIGLVDFEAYEAGDVIECYVE